MLLNIFIWLIIVAVAVLFAWLALRAWRARNPIAKWGGVVLSGVLTLVLAVVNVVTLFGLVKAYAPKNVPIPDVTVAGTPEQIQRGEHLANAFCVECHSTNRRYPWRR
jgi:high-affinity nickel permease